MKNNKSFFLIGIGGIGMSSIAQYLILKGYSVYGYDRTLTEITNLLESKGAKISFNKSLDDISLNSKLDDMQVIYSAAIKENHPVYLLFINKGFEPIKRAVFLASVVNNTESYAIAGTHGKTTTASILTHIFKQTNLSFSSFVGGVMMPDKTNFIYNGFDKTIVEADEFDRSFLNLQPYSGCITSIDADHLDIYKNHNSLKKAFIDFSKKIKNKLIIHHSIPLDGITYGINVKADYVFNNLVQSKNGYYVDLITPDQKILNVFCRVLGKYNLENMLAAIALADQSGQNINEITSSLKSFQGIYRRMSIYEIKNKILIDDYAHHPTEISSVHEALREKYPDSFIEVVFQPHLFSRTRDFIDDFAFQLSKFDRIKLMKIYPARENPIKGINSKNLLKKITSNASFLNDKYFNKNLDENNANVIAVLGAGSIGEFFNNYIKLNTTK